MPAGFVPIFAQRMCLEPQGERETPEIKYPEECWHCNACVLDCKQTAISLRIPLPAMMLHVEANDKMTG